MILMMAHLQQLNLLVLLFALMIAPLPLGMWTAHRMLHRLTVRRRLPLEAFAAEPVEVELEVHNPRRRLTVVGLEVRDRLEPGSQAQPTVRFAEIPPRATRRAHYRIVPLRRGLCTIGPALLITRFPFGLFEHARLVAPTDELIVYPPLGHLAGGWVTFGGVGTTSATRPRLPSRAPEEFHALREFRTGDNPRHIHWRTTARRGQLMVREFEPQSTLDTALVLELWMSDNPGAVERACIERLVSFAATVCVSVMQRQNARFALAIAARSSTFLHGPASTRLLDQCLTALAVTQGSSSADLVAALDQRPPMSVAPTRLWLASSRPVIPRLPVMLERIGVAARLAGVEVIDASAGDLDRVFTLDGLPGP
jgi:uncharacterized protein (DUF58 family)